jgi:hypothetical protein
MGRTFSEVLAELPKDRQADIRARTDRKVEEMLRAADTLGAIRKAVGKTQAKVAEWSLGSNKTPSRNWRSAKTFICRHLSGFLSPWGWTSRW